MGEVEPEVILVHQRTLLPDVGSEIFPQRCVNQVSGAVVSLDVAAADRVNPGTAGGRLELLSEDPANHRPLGVLAHLVNRKVPPLPLHNSGIADLSAGLHVEGFSRSSTSTLPPSWRKASSSVSTSSDSYPRTAGYPASAHATRPVDPHAQPGLRPAGSPGRRGSAGAALFNAVLESGDVHRRTPLSAMSIVRSRGNPKVS
jgi:hypothetical protein